jgi:hypothetical protein
MAEEEEKKVEVETGEPETPVSAPKEPEQPPRVDPEIANLRAELEQIKQEKIKNDEITEEKAKKFDEVSRAITGREPEFDKQKFFEELANDPMGTLDKFVSDKTKTLQEEIKNQKLKEADDRAFANLKTKFPDFNNVLADAGKYLTKEDIEATENLPNRTEIRFSLAKSRRDAMLSNKKTEETNALNEAKKISNQTSVTETPSTGAGIPTGQSEAQEKLSKAKENFDYNKAADILAEDLWHLSGQGRS